MLMLGVPDRFNTKLAKELGIGLHPLDYRVFRDGEVYARILGDTEEVKAAENVLLVLRGSAPSYKSTPIYVAAKFIAEKLYEEYDVDVYGLLTCMFAQRQDQRFKRGEVTSVMSARKELMKYMRCMVNVSLHDYRKEGWRSEKNDLEPDPKHPEDKTPEQICRRKFGMSLRQFNKLKDEVLSHIYNIDGNHTLAEYLATHGYSPDGSQRSPVLVISPDLTASESVDVIAKALRAETYSLEKDRDYTTGETSRKEMLPSEVVEGRYVIVNDDMIDSGGTMEDVIKDARSKGARHILCTGTHLILSEKDGIPALKRLYDAGADDLIGTNSIDSFPITKAKLRPQIARTLKETVFPKYGIGLTE